jgi:excinuclease UvrABC ATPase subunit
VRTPTGALEVRGAARTTCATSTSTSRSGVLCVVTGVAGSGKSSLIHGLGRRRDGVVSIDQGAIKGSRRSNPATYTGLLEPIRKAFAKANGVKPALFSANSEGACPPATGPGVIYTDLAMMAGVAPPARLRGQAVRAPVLEYRSAARTSARCWRCRSTEAEAFFGAGPARTPGGARDPRPHRRRGPGLPHHRSAPDDVVRR